MDIKEFLLDGDIEGEDFAEDYFSEQEGIDTLRTAKLNLKSLVPRLKRGGSDIDEVKDSLIDILNQMEQKFPSLVNNNRVLFEEAMSLLRDERFKKAHSKLKSLIDRISA